MTGGGRRTRAWAAVVAMIAGLTVGAAPAHADEPVIQTLPWTAPGPADGGYSDLSCPSSTSCLGFGGAGPVQQHPITARLAGGHWADQPFAVPAGASRAVFGGGSCPSTSWCLAVGGTWADENSTTGGRSLAEIRSGGTWTTTSPARYREETASGLSDVSCPRPGQCVAVGAWTDTNHAVHGLVEVLQNGVWNIPRQTGWADGGVGFAAVSCVSMNSCVAVGNRTDQIAVADQLRNGVWTAAPLPRRSGTTASGTYDVSCADTTGCVATGEDSIVSVAYTLTGTTWSLAALPVPSGDYSQIGGIACPAAGTCYAAGTVQSSGSRAFVDTLHNGSWTTTVLPLPAGVTSVTARAVACATSGSCRVLGTSAVPGGSGYAATLSAGQWTALRFAAPPAPEAGLMSVACGAAAACLAAGRGWTSSTVDGIATESLTDGTWTPGRIAAEPTERAFFGLDCATASVCVGLAAEAFAPPKLVALRLANGSWRRQPITLPAGRWLFSASPPSCPSPNWCVAVMSLWNDDETDDAFAAVYSDGSWTVTPLPVPAGEGSSQVAGVDCPQVGWCLAVVNNQTQYPLAEVLANGHWTYTSIGAGGSQLHSVSCPQAGECYAAGQQYVENPTLPSSPVVARLTGGQWQTTVLATDPGALREELDGISCTSPTTCVAVGVARLQPSNEDRPVLATLSGGTWQPRLLALPADAIEARLGAVSCRADSGCWAVGSIDGRDGGQHPAAVRLP